MFIMATGTVAGSPETGLEGTVATSIANQMSFAGTSLLPGEYQEHEDFETWLQRYETATQAIAWEDSKKLNVLPTRLSKGAFIKFNSIPAEEREEWETTKEALKKLFCPPELISLHQTRFWSKSRKPEEKLEDFAAEISQDFSRAFPSYSNAEAQPLLIHRFMSGLQPQLQRKVLESRPSTLQGALASARENEAWDAMLEERQAPIISAIKSKEEELAERVCALEKELKEKRETKPEKEKIGVEAIKCWRCGEIGHFARDHDVRPRPRPFQRQGSQRWRRPVN